MSEEKQIRRNPFDVFVIGARKGFQIVMHNLIPNILMAYVISYILTLLGVMDLIGKFCGPIMGLFGLPGEAIMVLLTAWLSLSAGIGIATNLAASGILNGTHLTILLTGSVLMGSQLQYMGRLLGVADVPKKYWPLLMLTSILNACCGMLVVRFFA